LAHISRHDGREFLRIAGEIKIKAQIETFPFEKPADILPLVKHGKIRGNAVMSIA
jgi:D-arabinose 1-dehydrogenase-like Zn-dependent alcohol dehydrogenase